MELSHEILDTIGATSDNDVMEVLNQEIVEEDITMKADATEDSVETVIEEIIEIIEEVEEEETEELLQDDVSFTESVGLRPEENERTAEKSENDEFDKNSETEEYGYEEDNTVFKEHSERDDERKDPSHNKNSSKQVITYDVDEDWQDEDMDEEEEEEFIEQNSEEMDHCEETFQEQRMLHGDKRSVNNQTISFSSKADRSESRDSIESIVRVENAKQVQEFRSNMNNDENVDNNVSHEIVKNVENNLLYTVLGTKKPSSVKTLHAGKLSDAHYIKVRVTFPLLRMRIEIVNITCKNKGLTSRWSNSMKIPYQSKEQFITKGIT